MSLTWNKAAGGGVGSIVAAYIVDALNQASTIYLQTPMPEIAQILLVAVLTGAITYYTPANVLKHTAAPDTKSGDAS